MPLLGPKPINGVIKDVTVDDLVQATNRTNTRVQSVNGLDYAPGSLVFCGGTLDPNEGDCKAQILTMSMTYKTGGHTHELRARCDVVDDLIERGEWTRETAGR